MALFKILKGNEADLPSAKHEGWAYVTEKGNMYVDLSADRRVKIGNRADSAEYADKATGDTKTIRETYLAKIKQVTSNGTTFTFRGETGDGTDAADLITIPLAGDKAGLISNAAQTIKGVKTFNDGVSFPSVTSTTYPAKSVGLTWSGSTDGAKIYYEVQASDKGMLILESTDDGNAGAIFRNSSSGKTVSIINGVVTGAFTGNLTGTANNAISDNAGKTITSYVHSVTKKSPTVFTVTKGDGTVSDIALEFLPTAGGTVHGELYADSITAGSLVVTGAARFTNGLLGNLTGNVTGNVTGNLTGTATNATKDAAGNIITDYYIHKIIQVTSNGTTFSFRGQSASGDNLNDLITIPAASASVAGLVTNGAQTFAGNKTFTGIVTISTSRAFNYSGIQQEVTESANRGIWFSSSGAVGIPVMNATKFNYNPGTDTLTVGNIKLNGSDIAATYVKNVALKSGSNYVIQVTKGDGTTSDVSPKFASSSSCGGAADSANILNGHGEKNVTTNSGTGKIRYSYNMNNGTAGLFAATDNANGILTISRHEGNHYSQLGFSSNGKLYYRSFSNVALNTTLAWKQIAFTDTLVDKATQAEKDFSGNLITSYVKTVTLKSGSNYVIRVTKGDGTTNDISPYFAGSSSCGGAANSAKLLEYLGTKGGNAATTGNYTKFASIDVSSGAWVESSIFLLVSDSESNGVNGLIKVHFRSSSTIETTSISMIWLTLNDRSVAKDLHAVKTANGKYDLYWYNRNSYRSLKFAVINGGVNHFSFVTQSSVASITSAAQSSLGGQVSYAETASKATTDSSGNNIAGTYIKSLTLVNNATAPTYTLTKGDGTTSSVGFPIASETYAGLVTTGDQSFEGTKRFNKALTLGAWNATIKCATWSRVCYIPCNVNVVGSGYIIQIQATRGNVVYNQTFSVNVSHSQSGCITALSGTNYSPVQVRVIVDSSGNSYFEVYDVAKDATNTTTQTVYCRIIGISTGAITKYTSFTDGSAIPSGFTATTLSVDGTRGGLQTKYVTADDIKAGTLKVTGTITDKNGNELAAALFVRTIAQKSISTSAYTIKGVNSAGDEITALTLPNATTAQAGLMTAVDQTFAGKKTFTNHTYIKYGVANLYIHSTSTAADSYSIIRLGTSSGVDGGYIFLNGPSRTNDGGANLMTIRNNFGNLRLNNNTVVTGALTVNQATVQTSNALYVNGTARIKSTNDSPNSQTTTASMIVDGGVTVMKQVSAKSVRIDNNDTAKGCTVKFNETGNYIEFVFD